MYRNLITSLFRHIDRRNLAGIEAVLAEDVVYERPGYGLFIGRERVLKFYRQERAISSGEHHLQTLVVEGRTGACCGRFNGLLKNGNTIDIRFAELYEFGQNTITKRTSYFFSPVV